MKRQVLAVLLAVGALASGCSVGEASTSPLTLTDTPPTAANATSTSAVGIASDTTDVVAVTDTGSVVTSTTDDGVPLLPTTLVEPTTTTIETAESISIRHTEAKAVAANAVTKLTTYTADMEPLDVAATLVGGTSRLERVVVEAAQLYVPGASSSGHVLFGQLGGMRTTSTSVMVVVDQTLDVDGDVSVIRRTVDVRLVHAGGAWRFEAIADGGGRSVERPAGMFPEAIAVVEDNRILLADSARWDIYRGEISPTLLSLMSEIADRTTYAVTVLSSGHPFNVFATNRQSNHTKGRALDIFSFDGIAVSSDHSTESELYEFVNWVYSHPNVRSVGSPWDIDGPGGRSFTDQVHLDHVHVALLDEVDNAP